MAIADHITNIRYSEDSKSVLFDLESSGIYNAETAGTYKMPVPEELVVECSHLWAAKVFCAKQLLDGQAVKYTGR